MPRFARDAEPSGELLEFLKYKLDDASYLKAESMVKILVGTSTTDTTKSPGAMDSHLAYDHNSTSPGRIVADRERAIAEVEPIVGRHAVIACDSAAAVFRTALDFMGVPTNGVHRDAFPEVFRAHVRARRDGGSYRAPSRVGGAAFATQHPDVARIKVL